VPFGNEAALRRRLDDAEMPVALLDPGLFEGALASRAAWMNDTAALDETLAFARRVGAPLVRIGALGADAFDPVAAADALRPAADAASRAGVRLAVRNAAGTSVATAADLSALLDALAHDAVGADWSPADALAAGESPEAGVEVLGAERVAAVSVTDALLASGDASVWLRRLAGWQGPLVLEVDARPAGPAGLAAATALVGAIRRAR
jgi:sugar phosphate isomerase/epimerase